MRAILLSSALYLSLAGVALAQTSVSATTDLNVRAGPGPQYPVIGMIGAGQATTLKGCLENSKWCAVATTTGDGWAYSDYLTVASQGKQIIVTERPANAQIAVVPAPANKGGGDAGAVAGGITGAVAGAIVGGPVGAAVGGAAGTIAGGATGTIVDPPGTVRTYVTTNQTEPVYLEGEVVVGASLPETVQLREIPDYNYRYVYVNGQPVLVDAQTRQIVYIVR